jgi:hypothetical protein
VADEVVAEGGGAQALHVDAVAAAETLGFNLDAQDVVAQAGR